MLRSLSTFISLFIYGNASSYQTKCSLGFYELRKIAFPLNPFLGFLCRLLASKTAELDLSCEKYSLKKIKS